MRSTVPRCRVGGSLSRFSRRPRGSTVPELPPASTGGAAGVRGEGGGEGHCDIVTVKMFDCTATDDATAAGMILNDP